MAGRHSLRKTGPATRTTRSLHLERARGPNYVIDVLYSDGTWQKEIDTFRDATTTVTPVATGLAAASVPVTVTATLTPAPPSVTPSATASPTVTPVPGTPLPTPTFVSVANCPSQPTGRFGLAFHAHAEVAGRLGCPTGAVQDIPMASEMLQFR
ncbi:MAG TPA: hypothetical protein VMW65_16175 [Chloroflexota bacterium]|nr:hypothetical protein [Chloroflexota bacterium]